MPLTTVRRRRLGVEPVVDDGLADDLGLHDGGFEGGQQLHGDRVADLDAELPHHHAAEGDLAGADRLATVDDHGGDRLTQHRIEGVDEADLPADRRLGVQLPCGVGEPLVGTHTSINARSCSMPTGESMIASHGVP